MNVAAQNRDFLAIPDAIDDKPDEADICFVDAAAAIADRLGTQLSLLVPADFAGADDFPSALRLIEWPCRQKAFAPQAMLEAIGHAEKHLHRPFVALPETLRGGDIGRRLAAAKARHLASGVIAIEAGRPVCLCGNGRQEHALVGMPEIWLIDADFAAASAAAARRRQRIRLRTAQIDEPVRDLGPVRRNDHGSPIPQADFILAGGNGVSDWPGLIRLAERLGAAVGASRPVCDRGVVPRDRQVGSSGSLARAQCYVSFGIAGAVQHLDGIAACRRIAAVNNDPAAPIHQRSDLSIIHYADEVIAAVTARLEAHDDAR